MLYQSLPKASTHCAVTVILQQVYCMPHCASWVYLNPGHNCQTVQHQTEGMVNCRTTMAVELLLAVEFGYVKIHFFKTNLFVALDLLFLC